MNDIKHTLLSLLTSKRLIIAVLTLVADALILRGIVVEPELVQLAAGAVTAIGALLIYGYTRTDAATAERMPEGYDHKGRPLADDAQDAVLALLAGLADGMIAGAADARAEMAADDEPAAQDADNASAMGSEFSDTAI